MSKLSEIFASHFDNYRDSYEAHLNSFDLKVASDILNCQSGAFGATKINCSDCNHEHVSLNGCGNRYCSGCQKNKGHLWATKQKEKLLPHVPYFMVTFTIPKEAHSFFLSNQKKCYDLLFKAGSEVIESLMNSKKNLGKSHHLGYFGVLHPGGRTMNYHPHVHFVVPNGGLKKDLTGFKFGRESYIFNVEAASNLFRAKMKTYLIELKLNGLPDCFKSGWYVNAKHMGTGEKALEYLSRYLFRSSVAESNLLSWDNNQVCFQYKKKGTSQWPKIALSSSEFFRRFFNLVLPKGFRKVRHFGFLSSKPIKKIFEIINIIFMGLKKILYHPKAKEVKSVYPRCIKCGSVFIKMTYERKALRIMIQRE